MKQRLVRVFISDDMGGVYREPAAICAERFAKLPVEVQQRLKFIFEDINDTDLVEELASVQYTTLLIFCNNLAFNQGTVNRYRSSQLYSWLYA